MSRYMVSLKKDNDRRNEWLLAINVLSDFFGANANYRQSSTTKPCRAYILSIICVFTLTACITHPPARVPLGNDAKNISVNFRATSDTNKGCVKKDKAPFGEITYSGLVAVGDERWVYLRDTKTCLKSKNLSNRYFGIVEIEKGNLVGAEVEFDFKQLKIADRPTDLEALCLQPGYSSSGSNSSFEMIASESGGYDAENTRRFFKLRFESRAGRWHAVVVGQPANYHRVLAAHKTAPRLFEAEGMLCDVGQKNNNFSITLADRGSHKKRNDKWVERRGGSLLQLSVDFSASPPVVDLAPAPNLAPGAKAKYPEIVAPHCKIPKHWKVLEGEWRDIADLYREGDLVWAVSSFEGDINITKPQPAEREYYCSVIYQLCNKPDCADLYGSALNRTVIGHEIADRKIEGLARSTKANTLSLASDEEKHGSIDKWFPLACASNNCDLNMEVIQRTLDLQPAIDEAVSYKNSKKLLVVFDIDDTLLTMTQDLGSVAWYKWQSQINNGWRPSEIMGQKAQVGKDTTELLVIQGLLYTIGDMRLTQVNTKDLVVDKLNAKGIKTYALTARGPMFESATIRELDASKITFPLAPECVGSLCKTRGIIKGRSVVDVVTHKFGAAVAKPLKNGREISINNGVMMVSGQDKGLMLRLLLTQFDPKKITIDSVIFIDDDLPNAIAVAVAARSLKADVSVYHYTRYENNVLDFLDEKKDRQSDAAADWKRIHDSICGYHSMSWCKFPTPKQTTSK